MRVAFVNNYTPPEPDAPSRPNPYGPNPWVVNYVFPVPPTLENDVVKLAPFIPRLHLDVFWEAGASDKTLYERMIPFLTLPMTKDVMLGLMVQNQKDPGWWLFLIIDKTKPEKMEGQGQGLGGAAVGVISMLDTSTLRCVRPSCVYPPR
jgi:hypothetical protein